jgi:DNA repair photolyase
MAAADTRAERCDRSVSTRGEKIADHARLPRCARAVSQSCGDHYKEPSRHARYRYFARTRGVQCRGGQRFSDVSRSTLQRVLEPRTTSPQGRLDAIEQLRAAKIPVGVMVAPIIPGLTDHEVPKILEACAKAGAQFAGYTISACHGRLRHCSSIGWRNIFQTAKRRCCGGSGICGKPAEQFSVAHAHDGRRNFLQSRSRPYSKSVVVARHRRAAGAFVSIISPIDDSAAPFCISGSAAKQIRARCFWDLR